MQHRIVVAATLLLSRACAAPAVVNLTTEYLTNPVAVDISWNRGAPRFGWQLAGGVAQTSYSILVSSTFPSAGSVWDSGTVQSAASTQIPYGGSPLVPDGDYLWTVTANFADGSHNSASGTFGTGPDDAAWAAQGVWIGGCTTAQASPQLRFSFALAPQPVLRAKAYATGLGIYTLHANGARVGGGADVLAPGWSTVPTARVLANAYDVAALLAPGGENVLGVRLGQAKYGYVYEFCDAGDASCYAALVRISITQRAADGSDNTTVVATGPAWECAPSPITFNHLFAGETYNASLEQPGWDAPGFAPAAPWTPAPLRFPNVSAVTTAGAPIRVMANVSAASVTARNTSGPVVAGGAFIQQTGSPDIFWVPSPNPQLLKHHLDVCQPCPAVNGCDNFTVGQLDGLAAGANFTCAMLPNATGATAYVFDLGRNMAGFCTLRVPAQAPPGTVLTLAHGEILTTDGDVDNTFGASQPPRTCPVNTINCADQMDQYIVGAGGAAAEYTPSFTFHGFRYVGLLDYPAAAPAPTLASLVCHQAYSLAPPAGGVSFNSTTLNQVQAAIVQTQRSNVFSIPSDCPTREKRGWMGDAQVSVDQALSNLQLAPFYESWLRTFSDSLFMSCQNVAEDDDANANNAVIGADGSGPVRPSKYLCCGHRSEFGCQAGLTPENGTGSLPDVVPFDSISGWPGDWVWQVAGEVIPHSLLTTAGNVPALRLLWPYVTAHMQWVSAAAAAGSADGLLQWGPYSDWLAEEPVSSKFAANWYYLRAAALSAEMAGALGLPAEAAAYTALAQSVSAAMVAAFFDAASGTWDHGSNANAQAMALAVNLGGAATANATATIVAAMVADVAAHNGDPTGGVASVRWILQGLTAGNRSDLALAMASATTQPSWGFMSTPDMPGTIWEAWTGDAHHSDGSKNHPMLTGGIGVWLYDTGLGLRFRYGMSGGGAAEEDEEEEEKAAGDALLQSPSCYLGFDPRAVAGLSNAELGVALRLAAQPGPPASVSQLVQRAVAAGAPRSRAAAAASAAWSAAAFTPTFTAAPDAAVVRALGHASGWHAAPQGRCALEWAWTAAGSSTSDPAAAPAFEMIVTVPAGVAPRLSLPLALLRDLAGADTAAAWVTLTVVPDPDPTAAAAAAGGAVARTLLDAAVYIVSPEDAARMTGGDGGNKSCVSAGSVGAAALLALCPHPAAAAAASTGASPPPPLLRPRAVSWAELEGQGRTHWGHHPAASPGAVTWAAGGLLFDAASLRAAGAPQHGRFVLRATTHQAAAATSGAAPAAAA